MVIECLTLGAFETNCYVLRRSGEARECIIIDPGLGADVLTEYLGEHKLNPVAVILTHGHADHIAGVALLREGLPGTKVYVHRLDADMLGDPLTNLSLLAGGDFSIEPAEYLLEDGGVIDEAGIKFEVLHTPGHTPGGISLYCEDEGALFSGDALFAGSVGRADFPGGNMAQLLASIRDRLLTLPEETVVYPGHGPKTTIGREKLYNPFLT